MFKSLLAWLPARVTPPDNADASMVKRLLSTISPLVSVSRWPASAVPKVIRAPIGAPATDARSEPGPESSRLVTTRSGICHSAAPMSTCNLEKRGNPRWSVVKEPTVSSAPASIAGEPFSDGMVCVGPP